MPESESAESGEGKTDSSKNPVSAFLAEVTRLRDQWRAEDKKKADCRGEGDDFTPTQLWFRGVDNADYELKPQVYRQPDDKLKKFPSDAHRQSGTFKYPCAARALGDAFDRATR